MPLSPKFDLRVKRQFEELVSDAQKVLKAMVEENERLRRDSYGITVGEFSLNEENFYTLRTSFLSFVEFLSPSNRNLTRTSDEVASFQSTIPDMKKLLGILRGLQKDYEMGFFDNLAEVIEADVVSDYMRQAEQLLGEGVVEGFDHVPAAVLAGAVLEDSLRRLCQRQNPPLETLKANGDKKTLDPLITDLQKVSAFNKAKADQLRAWAKIRNYAAHGEFKEFNRNDVETMISGVKTFIADYI